MSQMVIEIEVINQSIYLSSVKFPISCYIQQPNTPIQTLSK